MLSQRIRESNYSEENTSEIKVFRVLHFRVHSPSSRVGESSERARGPWRLFFIGPPTEWRVRRSERAKKTFSEYQKTYRAVDTGTPTNDKTIFCVVVFTFEKHASDVGEFPLVFARAFRTFKRGPWTWHVRFTDKNNLTRKPSSPTRLIIGLLGAAGFIALHRGRDETSARRDDTFERVFYVRRLKLSGDL